MFKVILSLLSICILASASDFSRANSAAADAMRGLDCEFEDCTPPPPPPPKVIVKEKVVYRDRPVVVEKEKVVYRDRPIIIQKEKVVYRDRPAVEPQAEPTPKPILKTKAIAGREYNKAFFDVHTATQAPMLDYIKYTKRGSFDVEQFADTVSKIKEKGVKVYIHGSIAVPDSIHTKQVYMSVGQKYHYSYYNYWVKDIYYNHQKAKQNSDYFLVNVKQDNQGHRYVDYKIYIKLEKPWTIKPSEENVAPNTFFFKMAPKTRGFKNKFVVAKPYIEE